MRFIWQFFKNLLFVSVVAGILVLIFLGPIFLPYVWQKYLPQQQLPEPIEEEIEAVVLVPPVEIPTELKGGSILEKSTNLHLDRYQGKKNSLKVTPNEVLTIEISYLHYYGRKMGYKMAEGSTIGEENFKMIQEAKSAGGTHYKTYEVFLLQL